MNSEQLAGAARYWDKFFVDGGDPDAALAEIELSRDDLSYIAEQRALRIAMAFRGIQPKTAITVMDFDPTEEVAVEFMAKVIKDGIVIGLLAGRRLSAPRSDLRHASSN